RKALKRLTPRALQTNRLWPYGDNGSGPRPGRWVTTQAASAAGVVGACDSGQSAALVARPAAGDPFRGLSALRRVGDAEGGGLRRDVLREGRAGSAEVRLGAQHRRERRQDADRGSGLGHLGGGRGIRGASAV